MKHDFGSKNVRRSIACLAVAGMAAVAFSVAVLASNSSDIRLTSTSRSASTPARADAAQATVTASVSIVSYGGGPVETLFTPMAPH